MQTRSYYVKLSILLVASTVCSPPFRKPTNQENKQMAPLSPSSAASVTLPGKRPRVGPGPSRAVPAKRRRDGGDSVGMLDRPSAHDTARRDANALMRAATNLGTRRDDDDADTLDGEIRPRINFLDLPTDTLYRYLEIHDLLPTWSTSPWSEQPVVPPNTLYAPRESKEPHPPNTYSPGGSRRSPVNNHRYPPLPLSPPPGSQPEGLGLGLSLDFQPQEEELPSPPSTRSRTGAHKAPTPPRRTNQVMTLSDVHAAHAVLAEKANQHWVKGLGGGQNKESETIVHFLYKRKVGNGKLLRVYNAQMDPQLV